MVPKLALIHLCGSSELNFRNIVSYGVLSKANVGLFFNLHLYDLLLGN